jgi:HNH endonuclease
MSMTIFRREAIRRLIDANGAACHYCKKTVRLRVSAQDHHADDATIDHKIPKAKGGTNADDNLLLACRGCNEAKEDRDYEDFLARPYSLRKVKVKTPAKALKKRRSRYTPKPEVIEATKEADKVLRWSMAVTGATLPRGATLPPASAPPPPLRPVPKMTWKELAHHLRHHAKKKGQPWPLA